MSAGKNNRNANNNTQGAGNAQNGHGVVVEPIQVVAATDSNNNNNNNERIGGLSIDIWGLLRYWASKWLVILLITVIGAAAGYGYHRFFVAHQYKADTSIFVAGSESAVISTTDLSISTALNVDYQRIITSRATLRKVIKDLNLEMGYRQLGGLITVNKEEDSHIITITATTPDPELSILIANSLTSIGIARIQSIISSAEAAVIDGSTAGSVTDVTPPRNKYIMAGGLIGLLFPLIIMYIIFMLDSTYKGEDEMVERLKAPILSAIPYYGKKKANMITAELDYYEKEAFNTLYGNISLSGVENKCIAITSAAPNEGKSSLSFKLAESITGFNKRVVYVDCDMRNSTFHELYGLDKKNYVGLSGYLSGQAKLTDVMIKDKNNPTLWVIPAGKNPPNPSALLTNDRFKDMMAEIKDLADYVIFDTPPVNMVIDGIFVARECDGTVLVVESAVTDRRAAEKAMEELRKANVNVLGVIVNKVGKAKNTYGYGGYGYTKRHSYGYGYGKKGYGYGKRYGKKGYGYGYGYGYGHEDNNDKK